MCQLPAISAWRHAPMLCWSRKHRPKAKCPGQSTSYGAKEMRHSVPHAMDRGDRGALIPYDDNHDQAEDYPEYFLSGEDSFVAVYLPCRIFFRRRWRPRTGCATLEMPLKNSVAHRQSAKPSRHT